MGPSGPSGDRGKDGQDGTPVTIYIYICICALCEYVAFRVSKVLRDRLDLKVALVRRYDFFFNFALHVDIM